MCEYLNYEVETLKRVRIMNIKLDMPVGEFRELTKEELKELNVLIKDSTKSYSPNSKGKERHRNS
jgi:23S rRNA pseudouridine2604 synthase